MSVGPWVPAELTESSPAMGFSAFPEPAGGSVRPAAEDADIRPNRPSGPSGAGSVQAQCNKLECGSACNNKCVLQNIRVRTVLLSTYYGNTMQFGPGPYYHVRTTLLSTYYGNTLKSGPGPYYHVRTALLSMYYANTLEFQAIQ